MWNVIYIGAFRIVYSPFNKSFFLPCNLRIARIDIILSLCEHTLVCLFKTLIYVYGEQLLVYGHFVERLQKALATLVISLFTLYL